MTHRGVHWPDAGAGLPAGTEWGAARRARTPAMPLAQDRQDLSGQISTSTKKCPSLFISAVTQSPLATAAVLDVFIHAADPA